MRSKTILLAVALIGCGTAAARSASPSLGPQPQPGRIGCLTGGGDTAGVVFFEFQVERTAVPRSVPERPSRSGPNVALIQFVVDTAGIPEPPTVKVIEPLRPASAKLQAEVATWRFEPAEVYGCRVRQVVQLPVWRKIL